MVGLCLQEDDGELHSGVLDLLPASNCGERQWINAHKEELLAARIWSLRMKSRQYRRLYIGGLALSQR
jgi:hypothetical protein